jgi:hypothetical protein
VHVAAREELLCGALDRLGRPGAYDLLPRRGGDPVTLAPRVSCAIASRPARRTSTPALTSSRWRSSICRRRVENSRSTFGATCSISAIPLQTGPQRTPRQPLSHRRAQVGLVEETRRLGVLIDRCRVK